MSREISKQVIVEHLDWCVDLLQKLQDLKAYFEIQKGLILAAKNCSSIPEKELEALCYSFESLHNTYDEKLSNVVYGSDDFLGEFVNDNNLDRVGENEKSSNESLTVDDTDKLLNEFYILQACIAGARAQFDEGEPANLGLHLEASIFEGKLKKFIEHICDMIRASHNKV